MATQYHYTHHPTTTPGDLTCSGQVSGREPSRSYPGDLPTLLPCIFKAISSVLQVFPGDLKPWCVPIVEEMTMGGIADL